MKVTLNRVIIPSLFVSMLLAVPVRASKVALEIPIQNSCALSAKEVVVRFVDSLFAKKQVRQAFERWVASDYVQHKAILPDGREAVIAFLEDLFQRYPDRSFSIHRIIASDDLVAVHYHSQATPEDLGFAVVDIFRVEDCRIVEHWDVVQPVPPKSANDNTVF